MRKSFIVLVAVVVLITVLLGIGVPAQGETVDASKNVYWVSASEGLDSNPGTIKRPFKTIGKALEITQKYTRQGGKDIYVVGGNYNEPVSTISWGIGIYGGYSKLTPDGKRTRDIKKNKTSVNVKYCGVTMPKTSDGKNATVDGFFITGKGKVFCISDASPIIQNNEIHAVATDENFIYAIAIDTNKSGSEASPFIKNNKIVVDDLWVEGPTTEVKAVGFNIMADSSKGTLTLTDNVISVGNGRWSSWGITVSQKKGTKANLVAIGNKITTGKAGGVSTPIYLASLSSNATNYKMADGSAVIDKNVIIAGEIDQTVKTEYQAFGASGYGISTAAYGPEVLITNNIIVGGKNADWASGISLTYDGNAKIYNNTIIGGTTAGESDPWGIVIHAGAKAEVVNNIICAKHMDKKSIGVYKLDGAEVEGVDYNLFCADTDLLLATLTLGNYEEHKETTSLNGLDFADGNIKANPLFVNETNNDYHIGAGSPAIDAGEDLSNTLKDDIDGQARPNGSAYDIGADEYY